MSICESKSNTAKRRYLQGSLKVMLSYIGLVAGSRFMVNHLHPMGWHLYVTAAVPTLPLLCFAYVVGRYLREENDEYQRDIEIRGMLWGTATVLSMTMFSGFLRAFGWQDSLPPFTEFLVFWIVTGVVKAAYHFRNRVSEDA